MLNAVLWLALVADPQPHLALMPLTDLGAGPALTSAVSAVVGNELQRLGVFRVSTGASTQTLLGIERQKQLLGCGEECGEGLDLSSLASFDYLVIGTLARVATGLSLELVLIDARKARRISSEVLAVPTEEELVGGLPGTTTRLVGKVLQGRQGFLVLNVSEAEAAVKVDGSLVGTTPLGGQLPLASGPHLLAIEKDGFVTWQREVRIAPEAVSEDSARLVPSADTIRAFESRNGKVRVGAWLTSGLAVVGVASAVGLQLHANALYGNPASSGFLFHRARLEAGLETEGDVNHRAETTRLANDIRTAQTVSAVMLTVGLASAAAATALWILGEPPNRYAAYHLRAQVALTPGGAALSGTF